MDKLIKPGRIIFAGGIIALGVICILVKDFIVGRPPAWPDGFNLNPLLAYISAVFLIGSAFAILINKNASIAAILIAALIFLLSILRHIPHFMNDWLNAYKSMALFGGALIIAVAGYQRSHWGITRFMANEKNRRNMVLTGCLFLAIFFIASGYAHFKFAGFVKDFIPSYIPFRSFWAYFCGICLLAGGGGLLIPATRRWAALFSGIMVLGWFILLHIPRYLANINDPGDRMGLCESFTFSGIFFVLASLIPEKPKLTL